MKTTSTQQEILLMTGTSFSLRQYSAKDDDGNQNNLTEKEQLEEACWNGLLNEILPEIYKQSPGNKRLYLWKITEARSFIELELGEIPEEKEKEFSIDPYSFMQMQLMS